MSDAMWFMSSKYEPRFDLIQSCVLWFKHFNTQTLQDILPVLYSTIQKPGAWTWEQPRFYLTQSCVLWFKHLNTQTLQDILPVLYSKIQKPGAWRANRKSVFRSGLCKDPRRLARKQCRSHREDFQWICCSPKIQKNPNY